MSASKASIEKIGLWVRYRYAVAFLVAFFISAFVALVGVRVFGYNLDTLASGIVCIGLPTSAIAYSAAFAGVYSGGLCLARNNRRLGCFIITIMGLICYQSFWHIVWHFVWQYQMAKHGYILLAVPLAVGGLSACGLTALVSRRKLNGKLVDESPVTEKI